MPLLQEICIIFITILSSLSFNLSCPGSGQWNFRAVFYCSDLNKYTCLLDTSTTLYTETCDGPRQETDGHKATINRNNFDTAQCRPDRFQPIDFTTVGNSDCVFQKSKCAQEGQIAAHEIEEKTSSVDTKCLCDYTKGYSFIKLPKDKCYCSPLVDDCSCFREFCPSGKILSPDYQCTTEIDMKNRQWNCSKIASADDGQNGDQVQQFNKDIDQKNEIRSRIAVQVIVPILVLIMAGLLIWCWKRSKLDKVKERTIRLVCEKKGDDNESKTIFIPTETQHSPEKKDKIQHKLDEKKYDREPEAIIISTEIPLLSDKNDKTQRDSTLSRLSSDRIVCDHENCLSTEEIKFLQTDDRTIDLISQTDQHDTPVPEHNDTDSDNQLYELAYESMTGINQIEDNKSVTYNSTGTSTKYEISKPVFQNGDKEVSRTLENHHSDKGDDSVGDICTVEDGNATRSTNDIGDKTEESNEENSMVEVEENKIKKNEELSTFAKEQKDKSDDPVEETCTVVVENEKTSTNQHKEKSDGLDEEICTDEAKNNTIKENRELNTSEKEHRDKSDESNDDICIDKAENISKIKEHEELNTSEEDHIDESDAKKFDTDKKPSEQDNTDQSNESDAKKSNTDNKKPSEQDNTDQSDELDAKKSDTNNKKPSEQNNTDKSDESDAKKSDTDNQKPSEEDSSDHIDESDAKKFDDDNKKPSDQYNTDHSDESDAKRSDTDNKKPSAQDNTDDNDELDAEKYDTENNKLSKSGTDDEDKRVNTETPNVTENATEENFDILLKGFED